jgi:orotate phosphoribosyltransferase
MEAKYVNLFKDGEFVSHSGITLPYKIDCDALGTFDYYTLAKYAASIIRPYTAVLSIPRGGDKFARELARYAIAGTGVAILADDVITTGHSFESAKAEFVKDHPNYHVMGLCVYARMKATIPFWVQAMYKEQELFS